MEKLDVPRFGQASPGHCVPTCLKMVLEYVRLRNGPDVSSPSISRIAEAIRTEVDGTPPRQIENVNNLLQKSKPSVEFKTVFMGRFQYIRKELLERRFPVIVLINVADLPDIVKHAIVLTHFDEETNEIFYVDPEDHNTEKHMEAGVFNNKWGIQAIMVRVAVGEREQRHMPEYWVEERVSDKEEEEYDSS